jgi:hypothetical protein
LVRYAHAFAVIHEQRFLMAHTTATRWNALTGLEPKITEKWCTRLDSNQ